MCRSHKPTFWLSVYWILLCLFRPGWSMKHEAMCLCPVTVMFSASHQLTVNCVSENLRGQKWHKYQSFHLEERRFLGNVVQSNVNILPTLIIRTISNSLHKNYKLDIIGIYVVDIYSLSLSLNLQQSSLQIQSHNTNHSPNTTHSHTDSAVLAELLELTMSELPSVYFIPPLRSSEVRPPPEPPPEPAPGPVTKQLNITTTTITHNNPQQQHCKITLQGHLAKCPVQCDAGPDPVTNCQLPIASW